MGTHHPPMGGIPPNWTGRGDARTWRQRMLDRLTRPKSHPCAGEDCDECAARVELDRQRLLLQDARELNT